MGETEVVPVEGLKPSEFAEFALKKVRAGDGYIVFKKCVAGRTIVLRIGPSGYGSYTATIQMRQGRSDYPEAGGELKDITAEAGCELYAWLNSHEACDTMQKALISPNGQALALCALFRLMDAHWTYVAGMQKKGEEIKELT